MLRKPPCFNQILKALFVLKFPQPREGLSQMRSMGNAAQSHPGRPSRTPKLVVPVPGEPPSFLRPAVTTVVRSEFNFPSFIFLLVLGTTLSICGAVSLLVDLLSCPCPGFFPGTFDLSPRTRGISRNQSYFRGYLASKTSLCLLRRGWLEF